jgi:putative ABC transport system permease protein
MHKIFGAIRSLFRRNRIEGDLDAEIRGYAALLEEEKMREGMKPNEAKRATRIEMVGAEQVKEEVRAARAGFWLETLWQDIRFGARTLRKNPGFTAVAVLTLALGIGANTAIFSLVDAVLIHPLPFRAPDQLVMLWEKPPNFDRNSISPLTLLDWKEQSRSFEAMAGVQLGNATITGKGVPEQVVAERVSGSFFDLLGVAPELGRGFAVEDEQQGHNVAIISHSLWSRRFAGDQNVVGSSLTIDGTILTVVGVLPARFRLIGQCDVWMPLALSHDSSTRAAHVLRAIARLKPGVSIDAARAEMAVIAEGIAKVSPQTNQGWGVRINPLQQDLVGSDLRATSQILFGAVGFVLIIACANVASLLLVRGSARSREFAVRSSLGASRMRISRQLLTESLLLSLAGVGLGILFATFALEAAPSWFPTGTLPAMVQLSLNWRVLAYSLVAAFVTGLLCGLVPTLHANQINLNVSLRTTGNPSSAGSRARRALVAGEIAMAVVLVMGAALLFQTLLKLEQVDRGYRADRVLAFHLSLPASRYATPDTINLFHEKTLGELNALPGVRAAALAYDLPLEGWSYGEPFEVGGNEGAPASRRPFAHYQGVSPLYFETLGIPLLHGRAFTQADTVKSEPVCIINDALATKYFPGRDPVGMKLIHGNTHSQTCAIVGVSGQVKIEGPAEASRFEMYVPYAQDSPPSVVFALRTDATPMSLVPAVRSVVQKLDRDLPVVGLRTIDDIAADSVARPRFRAVLIGVFAALALGLALIGIYGVMAYTVGQRTREFGIRMALGAQMPDVLRLVIGDGLRIALLGVALGLCASAALTRYLRSMLWGVQPLDALTFIVVPAVLLLVALIACYIPARRATKVDPLVALRYE